MLGLLEGEDQGVGVFSYERRGGGGVVMRGEALRPQAVLVMVRPYVSDLLVQRSVGGYCHATGRIVMVVLWWGKVMSTGITW